MKHLQATTNPASTTPNPVKQPTMHQLSTQIPFKTTNDLDLHVKDDSLRDFQVSILLDIFNITKLPSEENERMSLYYIRQNGDNPQELSYGDFISSNANILPPPNECKPRACTMA